MIRANGALTPRGLGRSYGDSALSARLIGTHRLDHFISFDSHSGALTCEAGVSLSTIAQHFVPRGWFLPVSPGTQYVTIGGAIASDVHGKNHHRNGSFTDHVSSIDIALGDGTILTASRESHADLFRATCGGMGLTGLILAATIRLQPIASSQIIETTLKAPQLDVALDLFEQHATATYSVAWIDCLARGRSLGRSLVFLGEHATDGPLTWKTKSLLNVPIDAPAGALNRLTVKAFNTAYYSAVIGKRRTRAIDLASYFYPLDAIGHWNRLYGPRGFVQYQFVLPIAAGREGLRHIIKMIAESGSGSFLAVLKVFGPGNDNLLSFPVPGYTLALDFVPSPQNLRLLDALDETLIDLGGRVYLTKDARMSKHTFRAGYPRWEEFQSVRAKYGSLGKFHSLQSHRLGLE
jgi:FAD/FMN-containing dehydrogenase